MKYKILSITIFSLVMISSLACAAELDSPENRTFAGIGYLEIGTLESQVLIMGNDFEYEDFGFSFDILALVGEEKPKEIDTFILKKLEYNTGTIGIMYQEFENVTLGQGLLVKNYSPWSRGPTLFSNKGVGLKSYYDGDIFGYDAFGTWSHVYGVRLKQDFFPLFILCESVVTDVDGFEIVAGSGTLRKFKQATGYSVDLQTQVFEDTNFYIEAAKLEDYGGGFALGIIFERDRIFLNTSFRLERRFIDPNFIPGYFGPFYEVSPIDFSLVESIKERKDGCLVEFNTRILGFVNFDFMLETYDSGLPAFGGDISLRSPEMLHLRVFYREPSYRDFRVVSFNEGKIAGGSIVYDITSSVSIGAYYKRSYNPSQGDIDESSFYEVKYYF